MDQKIRQLLASQDLDIRKSHYRFVDQKVTPDVLAFIADCVVNYPDSETAEFTKNDIWYSPYFAKNIVLLYNKPAADNQTARHEYDKLTAQPLKTLAYAGLLSEEKRGNTNYYRVGNAEILEHISLSDRNAFGFLCIYLNKVLTDSGFMGRINDYIEKYKRGTFSANDFNDLKAAFIRFMIGNTNINGAVEVRRIFPKVLNVLAVASGVPGTRSGRVTAGAFSYSDLMYNGVNFRDIGKLKNVSRQEKLSIIKSVEDYSDYEMHKKMEAVRNRHRPNSEVRDKFAAGDAVPVHHIFPKSTHPEMRSTLENLILLTAQQHNDLAHPGNRTAEIDPAYQLVCLLAKVDSVRASVMANDGFYTKGSLITVLNNGLGLGLANDVAFEDISQRLRTLQQSSAPV